MPTNYTYIDENIILSYFETGDFPTEAQFTASWTSYWHKSATIPQSSIEDLSLTLQRFADKKQFERHLEDSNAHNDYLLRLDASNIKDTYREQLRNALGVGDIPNNVALVDMGESQDVFNKSQINELCLLIADFVTAGKIRADKIEALGLTEIHEVTETTLGAFAVNSANYEFEKNDIIAIPDGVGNFALYIYKGGVKTATGNYLPTGLTNITIGMVEGLQTTLNGKLDKPAGTGGFFARTNGANTSWVQISPASYYLLLWDGSEFQASTIYQTGNKLGILTQTPSEALHVNGRVRAKAFVFDNNTEALPNQITLDGSHFWGATANGVRRQLMFGDFADYRALWQSLTDAEKHIITTEANGGYTTNTMSVFLINPVVIKNNSITYLTMLGANLNLNPSAFKVEIVNVAGDTVIATIPNSQVQLQANGLSMVFYYDFRLIPLGDYKIRLWNGMASYVTPVSFTLVNTVNNYDLSTLVWDVNTINEQPITNATIGPLAASFKGFVDNSDPALLPVGTPYITLTSSQIGDNMTMMDDFVIEFALFWAGQTEQPIYGGIVNDFNLNLNNTIAYGAAVSLGIYNLITSQGITALNNSNDRCIIYKKGNSLTLIVTNSNGAKVSQTAVNIDNKPVKFKICRMSETNPVRNQMSSTIQVISAYKTN